MAPSVPRRLTSAQRGGHSNRNTTMTLNFNLDITEPVAIIVAVIPLRGPRKAAPRSVPPMPVARVIDTTLEELPENVPLCRAVGV
jgi:hypothetical protein